MTSPVTACHPGVQGLVVLSINCNRDTETGFRWIACTAVLLLREIDCDIIRVVEYKVKGEPLNRRRLK